MTREHGPDLEEAEAAQSYQPLDVDFHDFKGKLLEASRDRHTLTGHDEITVIATQDGSEIHPDLKGLHFDFIGDNEAQGVEGVGVVLKGSENGVTWASDLTAKVFKDFTVAKGWMRQEAERLSKEAKEAD